MKKYRPSLASARAANNLAAMLEYQSTKETEMANKKTAKKKRLAEQKKQNEAFKYIHSKLGGKK